MVNDTFIKFVLFLLDFLTKAEDISFFSQFIDKLTTLTFLLTDYIPMIKNYLGLIFFFIPKEIIIPMIEITSAMLLIRIAVAIKKLFI